MNQSVVEKLLPFVELVSPVKPAFLGRVVGWFGLKQLPSSLLHLVEMPGVQPNRSSEKRRQANVTKEEAP